MTCARRWRDAEAPDSPLAVVTLGGAEKAGVFCAVSHCWDQIDRDKEVDLVNAVRSVRVSRPQLVTSLQEYRLCADAITNILNNNK